MEEKDVYHFNFSYEIPFDFTGIAKLQSGHIIFFKKGKYHNVNGPAVINKHYSYEQWYINNRLFTSKESFNKAIGMTRRVKRN